MSDRQLSIAGPNLEYEIAQRGSALFEHGLRDEVIGTLIDAYTEFTIQHPDPEPETMDAMLPDSPLEVLKKQLDELDRSQDKQKEWHKYRTNIPVVGKPAGYTNRAYQASALELYRGIHLNEDPKEFYHFFPSAKAIVEKQHEEYNWGKPPQEFYRLDTAFLAIHSAGRLLTEKVLGIMEDVHPEIKKIVTPKSISTSPVRLLFYHPGQSEELGAGHYDKGFMTFQIAESHEGLRIARDNESPLQMVRRAPEMAAFFPSIGLQENFPDTPFLPGWHDIIHSNELNQGRTMSERTASVCARWAIIFFVNNENFVEPDKDLTHHR